MLSTEFNLTVHVPADEWAFCHRRLTYLETLLLRVVRDRKNIQEWYDADELAALRLPGLPSSRAAISRKATAARWFRRREGRHFLYHVTDLPARSFDALIARILDMPEMEFEPSALPSLPRAPDNLPAGVGDVRAAPPWVLPLMGLMRGEAKGNLAQAWKALPDHLPRGAALPSVDEAATVLVELGLSENLSSWKVH